MTSARRNLRPSRKDTKEDESAKNRRSLIAICFPHREAFEQDFKGDYCDARTLCLKSVDYLESFQSRDTDHFWLDMSRSNYLTMLYFNCSPPELEKAKRQNDETLRRDPMNFNALWCRSELFLHRKKYLEVNEALQRMEDLLKDPIPMVTAKAELGVSYPDFGPTFYQKAIRLLEEALQELLSSQHLVKSDDRLEPRMIKWTFDLAHTYNRLMNKGTIQTYWDDSTEPCPRHEALFKRIKELFEHIAASGDLQYTAEAWIELGDAFKKYEEKVPAKERAESLPDGITVDDCMERALGLGPDDVFVLERCGRHYRQRATDISEFERAVEMLERCVERDPYRDVAYHHMGLAFRSMWLEMENHEEARIHTNKTKKHGEKQSIRKMQRQKSLLSPTNQDRPPAFNHTPHSSENSCAFNPIDVERGSGHSSVPYCRSRSEASASLSLRNDNQMGGHTHLRPRLSEPATPSASFQTIPPRYPKKENEIPKHYRKPDYYDKLRAGNPIAKDPQHIYLLKTRSCFQKASDIRRSTSCRYLVDLARTYVSTGDIKTAWDLLSLANKPDYSSNDGAYLYEQWGLMAEKLVKKEEDVEEDVSEHRSIEEVKNLYRQAIRFSAESKERSRVAFYRLRDIIHDQMQNDPMPETCILQKEHLFLYKTIQDARGAKEILDNMKSEENIVLMWELVELFHSRNRQEDAKAAFEYLALLADAKKLREPVDPEKDLEKVLLERIAWVIDISERRVRQSNGSAQATFSKAFEWLVSLSDGDLPSDKRSKDACVVCILAPSYETPGVERVMSVLTGVIGVDTLQGFVEDSLDLSLGKPVLDEIVDMVRRVRNFVVVMQKVGERMSEEELKMLHILKPLVNHPDFATKRFCRAVSSESTAIEYDTLDVHPIWSLDEANGKSGLELGESTHLGFSLLKALFSSKRL